MNDRDRALEKVRKLLAMSSDARSNVQEAETAARQAASLMAKFNIDQAEAQLKDLLSDEPDLCQEAVTPDYYGGNVRTKTLPTWVGIIGLGVGRLTQTKVDGYRKDGYGAVRFSGYRTDVVFAEWLFQLLCRAVYNEAAGSQFDRAGRDDFRRGAAAAIQGRLKELRTKLDEDLRADLTGATGTALVVLDKKMQVIAAKYGDQKTRNSSKQARDYTAREAGHAFGKQVNIPSGRPVTDGRVMGRLH